MKKLFLVVLVVLSLLNAAFATSFIGAKETGMGNCGAALSTGLSAVAYNPAGLMAGPDNGFELSLGGSAKNIDQLVNSVSATNDLATYLVNNLNTNLDANGTVACLLGVSVNKVGISLLVPSLVATLAKPAATIAGSASASLRYDAALTLGKTFATPGMPFASLDVGTNIKMINYGYGSLNATGTLPLTATQTYGTGSGFGFDVGARTTLKVPGFTTFSLGLSVNDIAASVTVAEPKSRTDTFNVDNTITEGTVTTGSSQTLNYPTSILFGCAGSIPAFGLGLAADIESISGGSGSLSNTNTITHLGLEYPMFANVLIARAGLVSGQNIARTTVGAKLNIPYLVLEVAGIFDGITPANTAYVIDIGTAF